MPKKTGLALPQTKLSDEDVRGIIWSYKTTDLSLRSLAEIYQVTPGYICRIVKRTRRQNVELPVGMRGKEKA